MFGYFEPLACKRCYFYFWLSGRWSALLFILYIRRALEALSLSPAWCGRDWSLAFHITIVSTVSDPWRIGWTCARLASAWLCQESRRSWIYACSDARWIRRTPPSNNDHGSYTQFRSSANWFAASKGQANGSRESLASVPPTRFSLVDERMLWWYSLATASTHPWTEIERHVL